MSDTVMMEALAADERARKQIQTDLATNFLVEAGAGSGKTTSLVQRMVSHVLAGHAVESLAAVTFTRKAAAELAERFREKLEDERRAPDKPRSAKESDLLDTALEQIDRSFVGTIHAFCGRLLRERPLEAELDPSFVEVTGEQWTVLCDEYWRNWVHRRIVEEDEDVAALRAMHVEPYKLAQAFRTIVEYQDITFPFAGGSAPDTGECLRLLRSLVEQAMSIRPQREPDDGWDALQGLVWRLNYLDRTTKWNDSIADFCDAIASIAKSHCKPTQKRWSDDKAVKERVKGISTGFEALLESHIKPLLQCWYEHRYGPVMKFLLHAAKDFEQHRVATGQLGFGDLLSRAAAFLARDETARRELGERFRYLMVDEFQDTDPLQAEVCFLLASEPSEGNNWRTAKPRPGALFVVGDPKQSIYRFRRADIETYDIVKQRMEAVGKVMRLTKNFRSVPEIGDFVNAHFANVFPAAADGMQAAFGPVIAQKPSRESQSVSAYKVDTASTKWAIYDEDADRLASWITSRLNTEKDRKPEDFLILTWRKDSILGIAKSLAARNVPAVSTGARVTMDLELEELLAVLRALADPTNPVRIVAALQGLFIGVSPADLFDAHSTGIRFSLLDNPGESLGIVAEGIRTLRKWRDLGLRTSVDSLVDTILDDTGLLAYTAGEEIGEARAGMLLRVVTLLRALSADAGGSLSDAIERIQTWLENDAEEATLRPGRSDAVRVMNIHQAKGLEAKIVILASPYKPKEMPPVKLHVERGGSGEAVGMMLITSPGFGGNDITIGQPSGWDEAAALEQQYLDAERERQQYVAVTRAESELWISQLEGDTRGPGQWDCFTESLAQYGRGADFQVTQAPGRALLADGAEEIAKRIAMAVAARTAASTASYELKSVSRSAKAKVLDRADTGSAEEPTQIDRGRAWGRAVHRVVEAMGLGRTGNSLREFAQAVVADELGSEAETELVNQILAITDNLAAASHWKTLMSCEERHFELPVSSVVEIDGVQMVTEGVIDAAGFDGKAWQVYDWKTDRCNDSDWAARAGRYQAQADSYAEILSKTYGKPAKGIIVRI